MKMTKIFLGIVSAAALIAGAAEPVKSLKVLTIGNSFANSAFQRLPKIVESDPNCKIKMDRANLGGCSLQRHWNEHLQSEKDPKHKPYNKKSLREKLTQEKWDIVTIQQASPSSWKQETYQPYADNIIKLVKELAPSAEIVIQQTWSYNAADGRLGAGGSWKITQEQMYEKLDDCYTTLAKKYNFRIIPTGYAVQLYRKALGDKLIRVDKKAMKTLKKPQLPANNDVVGNFSWRKAKGANEETLNGDWIHMNPDGQYLQGLVWYGILFGKDPMTVKYIPRKMKKEQAELLKKCAAEAVKTYPQVKK